MNQEKKTKEKFWTKIWSNRSKGNFVLSDHEITHVKKLPGGWLLRHRFMAGKQFSRSGIIFIPDPEQIWKTDQIETKWERIFTERTPNYIAYTSRMKTPQGWVMKELLSTKRPFSREGTNCLTLTYIEDRDHQWKN
ncbi:hypothetical protein Dthio_PD3544 [Desulfonatronospira thiodismutans ASO3-1]|uniref:Uncharacterized protein n=1 Tax=Desulfonatronospira thiodismutans ASO3-1 TaxID=555779 RepID=D6SN35_9BACT|nr:hypothetical protein [Desulfonatronospira thiodismutans]EFI36096.1 hypothetical protein Dthio_PD3544 [Desulfonatronospira thiodismutans ASO3-1]